MKWILLLLLIACGRPDAHSRSPVENNALQVEAKRVAALSPTCDDMPIASGNNGVTGRVDCDSGDSMLWAGLLYSAWPQEKLANAIKASIDDDGRPFRSPEHRKGRDDSNAFSRDMYMGFLYYCHASKDLATCSKVLAFARRNDYQLCTNASDTRCLITPSMMYLTGAVWKGNGWDVGGEYVANSFERAVDEQLTLREAKDNKLGYRTHLVSLKVFLYYKLGNVGDYRIAAKKLHEREPSNLWYQNVAWSVGMIPQNDSAILIEMMKNYSSNRVPRNWFWQGAENAMGQDLVFLACVMSSGCTGD